MITSHPRHDLNASSVPHPGRAPDMPTLFYRNPSTYNRSERLEGAFSLVKDISEIEEGDKILLFRYELDTDHKLGMVDCSSQDPLLVTIKKMITELPYSPEEPGMMFVEHGGLYGTETSFIYRFIG